MALTIANLIKKQTAEVSVKNKITIHMQFYC